MSDFSTVLTKVNDNYFPMIERQLTGNGIEMDQYSKSCVLNAISAINTALDAKGISWNDEQLDRSNITQTLIQVASLKLNAAASPREVYFQVRNIKVKGPENRDIWKKQIEMGIEGDGNDAILARFGRDVKKVGQYWQVREGDDFTYPQYTGFDVVPPTWSPKGKGDVVRVVYPIMKTDGTVEFHIAERDDVTRNLIAHMNNNMMNETFGLVAPGKTRFDATPEQKKKIAEKKAEILNKAKQLGLASLDDPELQQYISPAWTEPQSRESMIIRKMRNNVVKKIPKDFGNAFVELTYHEAVDDTYAEVKREIAEHANGEVIDVEPQPVTEINTGATNSEPEEEQQTTPPAQGVMDFEIRPDDIPPTGTEGPDF